MFVPTIPEHFGQIDIYLFGRLSPGFQWHRCAVLGGKRPPAQAHGGIKLSSSAKTRLEADMDERGIAHKGGVD